MFDSLIILLIDVETVGQAGEKSFYNHIIHGQSGFQAPEDGQSDLRVKACVCLSVLYRCVCV